MVIGVIFIQSSIAKLSARRAFTSVLRTLGLRRVEAWWAITISAELLVAAVAVFPLKAAIEAVSVLALASVFALAGVRALALGKRIECACFGGTGRELGWRQLIALPVWGLGAGAIALGGDLSSSEASALGAAVIAAATGIYVGQTLREVHRAYSNRLVMKNASLRR